MFATGPNDTPENGIYTGDCMELAKLLPDQSVDLIFTDPPYLRKFLYLYEWLAVEASRLLKPGGFVCTYAGAYHKAEVIDIFNRSLSYFWDLVAVNYQGPGPLIWQRKIVSKYKSILVYHRKGEKPLPRTNVLSVFNGTSQDKHFHVWQQDLATARYYIDCFAPINPALIFDPFCGGGTVAYACKQLSYPYLAFEIDPGAAARSRQRIAEAYQPPLSSSFVGSKFALGGSSG